MLNAAPLPDPVTGEVIESIASCDVLVVNEGGATQLLGGGTAWEHGALDPVALGPTAVVITLGADGAVAAVADKVIVERAFPPARRPTARPSSSTAAGTWLSTKH